METSRTSLSVIIPTYNRAGFVRDCLIALESSGVPDLEVIVVDDGSTDDTESVVEASPLGARYLRQANAGPAAARNNGFRNSHGQYVGFLDCDDEWLPEAPAEAIRLLNQHPEVDVLFADAHMGNRKDGFISWIKSAGEADFQQLPHCELSPDFRLLEPRPFFQRMVERNAVFLGATILRRSAFERAGEFDRELCGAADWNLWLRMASQMTFGFWNKPLAIYTKHIEGMSNDYDGMYREFCTTLRKLPKQAPLDQEQRTIVERHQRDMLFGFAYRAYNRGDFPEARKRFSDLLATSGFEMRAFMYRLMSSLPFGLPRRLRKVKHFLTRTGGPGLVETAPVSSALAPSMKQEKS